jgi:probable HAF family extracellular repeat protein
MAIPLHQRLLLLAAVLTAPFPARAITTTGQYTVTILGRVQHNYPGSAFNALCLNDNGVIAGFATVRVPDNFSQTIRGVLWQSSTPHYTILGTLSEALGFDSEALWVNNSGIAVGDSQKNTGRGYSVTLAVMFTPNGLVNLGIKNSAEGKAMCINNYGQVVGYTVTSNSDNSVQGFLYQNGVTTLLGCPVPNPGYSVPTAINDSGLIIGSAVFASGPDPHAAFYANGAWVDLGVNGAATSVNASGTIVGFTSEGGYFIYQDGQLTYLNASQRPGDPFINNAGQIVQGDFIYQNGLWQDLNDLDLGDGWFFSQALGINNQGAIIGVVFREVNGTYLYRSALLTPVSPSPNQQAATRAP